MPQELNIRLKPYEILDETSDGAVDEAADEAADEAPKEPPDEAPDEAPDELPDEPIRRQKLQFDDWRQLRRSTDGVLIS
ncbi:hypothetical protein AOQ84DRAFT_224216 [Glonium stellatum]|uniref:Uncharacterized protein n=1 Tax=Glonium stellatum TaxID=574774 RepID=A0A8E2EWW6_9PEZI|nr:hypothetical protein AOQ84DRAFT_224216 [Glonium stellatum]